MSLLFCCANSNTRAIFFISFSFYFSHCGFYHPVPFPIAGHQQISDQIQNLTVSSTTSNSGSQQSTGSSSTAKTSEKHGAAASAASSNNLNLTNILKDTAAAANANTANESLAQRVKFLQTKLAHAPMPSITSKRRQLPSIEEAWNLPISAEMSSRQQQTAQSNQQRAYAKNYNHVSASCSFKIQIIFLSNRDGFHINYCMDSTEFPKNQQEKT